MALHSVTARGAVRSPEVFRHADPVARAFVFFTPQYAAGVVLRDRASRCLFSEQHFALLVRRVELARQLFGVNLYKW